MTLFQRLRDLRDPAATSDELGVKTALSFAGPKLGTESVGQGDGLDLRVRLKSFDRE